MTIFVERYNRVSLITLNRPASLNALNSQPLDDLIRTMQPLDKDPDIGCFIIAGSEKYFAAGADIKEMVKKSALDMAQEDFFASWQQFTALQTPKIAAVAGYALGVGCELAMMCDIIYAAESAHFGQPEIKLGVIPGIGGTQRLPRLIGKSKAMEMVLTGRMMDAEEAESSGLVARIFQSEQLLDEILKAAELIASYSKPAVRLARECIDRVFETNLKEGLLFERRMFHSLFSTEDQKEGMNAFLEKRIAHFIGR